MSEKGAFGILVGGGPAPGINGVIRAAALEAMQNGHTVYGIHHGYEAISMGDSGALEELTFERVASIGRLGGSILGTSRANPRKDPSHLDAISRLFQEKNIEYLVSIGGDDTVSSARALAQAGGGLKVAHVPKTIDNDLPLPEGTPTFGYMTATERGVEILDSLLEDARTTRRWYIVIAMGRHAGHLALNIGSAAGATRVIIPEEFQTNSLPFQDLIKKVRTTIISEHQAKRPYGVIVLAEGLADIINPDSLSELQDLERDPHGNVRFSEIDFGRLVKSATLEKLQSDSLAPTIVSKDIGYELRCCAPVAFDRVYTQLLGSGVVRELLGGNDKLMIAYIDNELRPIPFSEFIDEETGRAAVRKVNTASDEFRVASRFFR